MKFRTKLILGFSCVVFMVSAVLGIVYFQYNTNRLTENEEKNMTFYAEQLSDSIDASMDSMKQVTDYILSNPDMLCAMQVLPRLHENGDDIKRKERIEVLTSGISLDYVSRNFYRVIIFNEMGDVACSTNVGLLIVNKERDVSGIKWLEDAAEKYGKPIIVAPHKDGWGEKSSPQVFSLVRKVQGGNFGYIEVQNEADKLENVFKISDPEVQVAAWLSDGTLLYQSDEIPSEVSAEYLSEQDEKVHSININDEEFLLASSVSENFGIQVVAMKNTRSIFLDIKQSLLIAGALTAGCFFICMVVVIVIANRLSKPIESLRKQMENTGLENMDGPIMTLDGDDEVKALGIAYQNLLKRLNEAMIKEQRLSILQLQAQFDTLQAQINPHFLYNVLNTISNRGIIDEDEQICEICGSLAAMLRYSSNNKERYATVKQELEYLDKYIYLLKSRYEHRLEVEVTCSPEIMEEILPKLVLQQLVENSVQHGYTNGMSVMKISVSGWRKGSAWFLQVRDNGEGITPEAKEKLDQKMKAIRERILRKSSTIEMEIGGMGLANTYARMFLIYAEDVVFDMGNSEDGFCITVGVDRKDVT